MEPPCHLRAAQRHLVGAGAARDDPAVQERGRECRGSTARSRLAFGLELGLLVDEPSNLQRAATPARGEAQSRSEHDLLLGRPAGSLLPLTEQLAGHRVVAPVDVAEPAAQQHGISRPLVSRAAQLTLLEDSAR